MPTPPRTRTRRATSHLVPPAVPRAVLPVVLVVVAAIAATGLVVSTGSPPVAAAVVAPFTDTLVASVPNPTAVEQLPNGNVVVTEQNTGRVRIIDANRALLPTPAIDLDVCAGGERGLLGFTHDPDVGANGRVYIFYTRDADEFPGGCVNRVSAFRMAGTTIDPASEQVLIDNISSVNGNHNGGDLEVGNDGFLYIATGDAGRDPRENSGSGGLNDAARDRSLLNGKILRVDRFTGAPAPGNPLRGSGTVRCRSRGNLPTTPTTQCQEIFAWGLRNPYRFAFDPNTSATRFFINDVGQSTREEVNLGAAGADYGWNIREGRCPQGQNPPCPGPPFGLTDPITDYPRSQGTYVTGGAFVPDGQWPAAYDGGYLFGDGGSGRIWLRRANGSVDYNAPFVTDAFGLADMAFVQEPNGLALYYTKNGSAEVRRISYAAPTASVPGAQRFVPAATPRRAFDSREQSPASRIRGGTTRLIPLGVPAGSTSALVNITLVRPAGPAFATAWQPRTARPDTSNVNAPDGNVVANSAVVQVDSAGRMLLYVRATADVVIDVMGSFSGAPGAVSAGRFSPAGPTRAIDTRAAPSAANDFTVLDPDPGDTRLGVPIAGRFGVPSSDVAAVALIVTAVSGRNPSSGFVTVHRGGTPPPVISNLNANGFRNGVGDRRANLVVAPVGTGGRVDVLLHNVDDVVIDVVGWFTDGSAPSRTAGRYFPVAPRREVDTRSGVGFAPLGRASTRTLDPVSVPASASAVLHNLTLAPSANQGFLTAYPTGGTVPVVSNLNATGPGQVRAALAITKLSGGRVSFFSQNGTQLVVDAFGYFS
jgi:glucose/arabinose dehydrogenase